MNKKKKYAYAAMTSASLAIAVIIVINIIVVALSDKVNLNIDMTKGGILDFDKQTIDIVNNLDMDVNIISLIPESNETDEFKQIDEILNKYNTMSDHITYTRVDTKKNPVYLANYSYEGTVLNQTKYPNYHIIFETERAAEVVDVNSVVPIDEEERILKELKAEQYFTSAILKVTKGSDINVYLSSGHGEMYSAEDMKQFVPGSGYNFKDLSLGTQDIPDDADMIVIVSPKNDYSISEIDKMAYFLDMGGDIQVMVDYNTPELNNLFTLLGEWGISVESGLVCDDNSNHFTESRTALLPVIHQNDVTENLMISGMNIMFPSSRPVRAENKNDIVAYTIASTSEDGYIKPDVTSIHQDVFEPGDVRRTSDVAVLSARYNYSNDTSTRVFVSGTSGFVVANQKFYSELVTYMTDKSNTVFIQSKDIEQSKVLISQSTIYLYAFVVIALIPIIIIVAGFIIWVKRRHL
ncbi:MAG: Gldg family protein [Clostridia bacterium]|nr:Gldg family protein [Clostridia bacterium]